MSFKTIWIISLFFKSAHCLVASMLSEYQVSDRFMKPLDPFYHVMFFGTEGLNPYPSLPPLAFFVCVICKLRKLLIFSEPTIIWNPVSRGSLMSSFATSMLFLLITISALEDEMSLSLIQIHWEIREFLLPSFTWGLVGQDASSIVSDLWSAL